MRRVAVVLLPIVAGILLFSCRTQPTDLEVVAAPIINPPGGSYEVPPLISISCPTPGATIVFTLDGSTPHHSSYVYTAPFYLPKRTMIKAKAYKSGMQESTTVMLTFAIEIAASQLVYIPGGTFTMGGTSDPSDNDQLPTHSVTLNNFYLGKYEVTQAEWEATMGSNPAEGYGTGPQYPVFYMPWYSCIKYCNLRSLAEGLTPCYSIRGFTNPANWGDVPTTDDADWNAVICDWSANGYRLPTEAEWEYAARGATNIPDYRYSGSDDLDAVGWWYNNNSPTGAKPVGGLVTNGLGIFDMSGNIWERCWDWYSSTYYGSSPADNPRGPGSGSLRVMRGGKWDSYAYWCRTNYRAYHYPYFSRLQVGLRLCRSGL